MATKSVIDIEIDDSKFLKFKSVFDDYKKSLEETPTAWSDANSEMGNMVQASQLLKNDAERRLALLQSATLEESKAEKAQQKQDEARRKSTETRKKTDLDAIKRWKELGSTIASTTVQLAKFAGIGLGLATGAATFGMGGLASSASSTRFQSMGLGVSSGAMQSADLNYAKLLSSPIQSLKALRESQTDISQAWKFSTIGIQNSANKSTEQLLPEVLTRIREILRAAPQSQRENIAKNYGMDSYTSAEDRQRAVSMSDAEFAAENKRYQQDLKMLAVSDSTLKSYQDLDTQWERFKQKTENTFIKGLEPLAPALGRLNEAAGNAFDKLMSSDKLEPIINKLAAGITKFSAWIDSIEEKDFDDFISHIKAAGAAIGTLVAFIGTITPEGALGGAALVGGGLLAASAAGSLVGGAASPVLAAGAAGGALGYGVYENDSAENQEWTQKIVGGIAALFGDKDAIAAQKQIANYTKSSDKALENLKPMTAEEYKKAEADSQNGFVSKIGETFKSSLSDLWEKTKEVATDTVEAIKINSTYTPMGDIRMSGDQKQNMKSVYEAYRKAGLSDKQSKVMTAEVGRENDYADKYLFGSHTDPHNKATNTGFLSWQGQRGAALRARLEAKGLIHNGKIDRSQEALDEQARFSVDELNSGQYGGIGNFMQNKDVDYQTGSRQLGKGYVKWRFDDPKYQSHKAREAGYYNKLTAALGSQSGKVKDTYALRKPTPAQQKSVMFGDQGGMYGSNSSRVLINVNNSTGGSATASAVSL